MMAASSLRRVTMDDYNTKVRPGNQLDKASHVERGPIFAPPLLTVSQWGPHRYSQFHGWPPHFKMSISNHSFPHWQGGVKRLPAALHRCHVSG